MDAVLRGVRNVFRNPSRSITIILILGLSVFTFVTLTQVGAAMAQTGEQLKASLASLLEVRRAGATGMGKGADPLPEELAERIARVPNVNRVQKYLFARNEVREWRFPVWVLVGIEPGQVLRVNGHGEIGTPTVIAGRSFVPEDVRRNVAIVGRVWAEQYEGATGRPVTVGMKLLLEGSELKESAEAEVIGLYSAGFEFGDNQVLVPLFLAQQMAGQVSKVSNIFVTVDSVDNVEGVENGLRAAFGQEVDVLAGRENLRVLKEGLDGIQSSSRSIAALTAGAGAMVVLLTMVLVVRQRRWEIGTLKALGASGADVARQFVAEALALSVISGVLGLVLFAVAGPRLGGVFLGSANLALPGAIPGFSEQLATGLAITYTLTPVIVGYALGAISAFGVIGSLYPIFVSLRLRPIEAMRRV